MVEPFPQDDLPPVSPLAGGELFERSRQRLVGPDPDTLRKIPLHLFGDGAVHQRVVGFGDVLFGGEDIVGKGPVVGQQHKAGGVLVEPSGREQPLAEKALGHQVHHRPFMPVLAGADHPFGLVEHQVKVLAQRQLPALHRYRVAVKIDAKVGAFDHLPVDGDLSFADEGLDLAAGKRPLHGDGLVQPLFFCHFFFSPLCSVKAIVPQGAHREKGVNQNRFWRQRKSGGASLIGKRPRPIKTLLVRTASVYLTTSSPFSASMVTRNISALSSSEPISPAMIFLASSVSTWLCKKRLSGRAP